MNKKGFTLVEIVIGVSLILLLILLVVPNFFNYEDATKRKLYEGKVQLILAGAYKYGVDNIDSLGLECNYVSVQELLNLEYLEADLESDDIINPIDNLSMGDLEVCVTYENGSVKTKLKE